MNICQLRSASQFSLAIQVDDKPIRAVVDSAAEVNIISDGIYQSIGSPPHKVKYVTWEKHLIGKILCCWIQMHQTLQFRQNCYNFRMVERELLPIIATV